MGHDLDDEDDGSDFFKALDRHDLQPPSEPSPPVPPVDDEP
jgi:hypothetical protein